MITRNDVLTIVIPENDLELIRFNAREAEIGGSSQVRNREDRKSNLAEDQLVGQMVNYASVLYLTDSTDPYREIREQANRNKYEGDGGIDIPDHRIDAKGSLMRGSSNPVHYRLPVRPKERHSDWVYILGLVRSLYYHEVYLVGWTTDDLLPSPDKDGIFKGAHTVFANDLFPMTELKKNLHKFQIGESSVA